MPLKLYPLEVAQIIEEATDAFSIVFNNPDPQLFSYKPGQYLTVQTFVDGKTERRAFSLSSAPGLDVQLKVTLKCLPNGKVTQHLRKHLQPGDKLEVLPPVGNFTVELNPAQPRHYVLLGAGSGITPLISMLRAVLHGEPNSSIYLLYGNRSEESIIFYRGLTDLAYHNPARFTLQHVLSSPAPGWSGKRGRLAGEQLKEMLLAARAASTLPTVYYLCGPSALMEETRNVLAGLQVDAKLVHTEYYTAPLVANEEVVGSSEEDEEYEIVTQTVKVKLDGKTHSLTVTPKKSILGAALEAGLDPPYACQEGVCCTCRAKLHQGLVVMDEREGLSDEEIEAGYILTCQSHPLTEDVMVEYG